jgi:O-antigen/teichoic acid export membrane protein
MKQSMPFALMVLLMTFYNRLDPVMLGKLLPGKLGDKQIGIYASGFRLLDAANMIAYLFGVLLIPVFSRMIKHKQSVEKMVKLSFTLLITVAIIVAIGSVFYSYELMDLLYDEHILESARVYRLLMGGFVAVSTTYIFGTLLTANGNLKELTIISACGLMINFLINIFLIPKMEAVGSAYASLITQFFIAIAQVIIVQKVFKFKINYRYLSTLILFILGVVIFNIISRQLFPIWKGIVSPAKTWFPNFVLMILFSFGLAGALKLLNIRSLAGILREDQ